MNLKMSLSNGTVSLSSLFYSHSERFTVPTDGEIDLVLDVIEQIGQSALQMVESLIASNAKWDNVSRNDFCRYGYRYWNWNILLIFSRYLHACRSVWIGLPTFLQEQEKTFDTCLNAEHELQELVISHLNVKAGFTLTDPNDLRYQKVAKNRNRFGEVILHAATTFRNNINGEDHTDAVIGVVRAIDTYLLIYGLNRSDFSGIQKNYTQAREFVSPFPYNIDHWQLISD